MSFIGETFLSKIGAPNPALPCAFHFENNTDSAWKALSNEIGAGWYQNRFLFLFGDGLRALNNCLGDWDFLFPQKINRQVIGRNAYGALLVVEEAQEKGFVASIGVLNPLTVSYITNNNLIFSNLLGTWLPHKKLPDFHDAGLYNAWHKTTGEHLDVDEILAIKKPFPFGGKMEASNFQVENILEYYNTTGKIYQQAFSRK